MINNFIATVIESWLSFYHDVFSDAMFEIGVYGISFWLILLIPILSLAVFYKLIDVVGGKLWHFIITVIIILLIEYFSNVGLLFSLLAGYAQDEGFSSYVYEFSFYATLVSIVSVIIGTAGLRYISTNNRYNPF
jgi:hypothetical protein